MRRGHTGARTRRRVSASSRSGPRTHRPASAPATAGAPAPAVEDGGRWVRAKAAMRSPPVVTVLVAGRPEFDSVPRFRAGSPGRSRSVGSLHEGRRRGDDAGPVRVTGVAAAALDTRGSTGNRCRPDGPGPGDRPCARRRPCRGRRRTHPWPARTRRACRPRTRAARRCPSGPETRAPHSGARGTSTSAGSRLAGRAVPSGGRGWRRPPRPWRRAAGRPRGPSGGGWARTAVTATAVTARTVVRRITSRAPG